MNKENVLAVADAIEKHSIPDLGFNMRALLDSTDGYEVLNHFEEPCGTIACIAGWAHILSGGQFDASPGLVWDTAVDWLNLPTLEAKDLFAPKSLVGHFNQIEPSSAVRVLRHLAETGEVDWSVA